MEKFMLIHTVRLFFVAACLLAMSCESSEPSSGGGSLDAEDSIVKALKAPSPIEVIKTN